MSNLKSVSSAQPAGIGYINLLLLAALLSFSVTLNKDESSVKFDDSLVQAARKDMYMQCKKDYQYCQLDSFMTMMHEKNGYNGVILIAENGQIVYEKGFGHFRRDTTHRFSPASTMQLASVSKPFTAMTILMLIEQGKLDYEDDIRKFLPAFPYKGVTVRHLLNHTAGLPDYLNSPRVFSRYIRDKKQKLTNQQLLDLIVKYRIRLEFVPGTRHHYSNTGYALLALIVEKVSGMPFHSFVQQEVFDALNMCNTFMYNCRDTTIKMPRDDYRDGILGDKGIFSTVEDMLKWDQALYTEKLVKRTTLDMAFAQGRTLQAKPFDYGYGWRLRNSPDGTRIIYHRGFWQEANPMFIRFIDCNRTIISLNHPGRFSTWYMVDTIADIMNASESFCGGF